MIERQEDAWLRLPCAVGCSPECAVCRRRKAPVGRSVPPAMAGGLCDFDCPGYYQNPKPCDLWPREERDGGAR